MSTVDKHLLKTLKIEGPLSLRELDERGCKHHLIDFQNGWIEWNPARTKVRITTKGLFALRDAQA